MLSTDPTPVSSETSSTSSTSSSAALSSTPRKRRLQEILADSHEVSQLIRCETDISGMSSEFIRIYGAFRHTYPHLVDMSKYINGSPLLSHDALVVPGFPVKTASTDVLLLLYRLNKGSAMRTSPFVFLAEPAFSKYVESLIASDAELEMYRQFDFTSSPPTKNAYEIRLGKQQMLVCLTRALGEPPSFSDLSLHDIMVLLTLCRSPMLTDMLNPSLRISEHGAGQKRSRALAYHKKDDHLELPRSVPNTKWLGPFTWYTEPGQCKKDEDAELETLPESVFGDVHDDFDLEEPGSDDRNNRNQPIGEDGDSSDDEDEDPLQKVTSIVNEYASLPLNPEKITGFSMTTSAWESIIDRLRNHFRTPRMTSFLARLTPLVPTFQRMLYQTKGFKLSSCKHEKTLKIYTNLLDVWGYANKDWEVYVDVDDGKVKWKGTTGYTHFRDHVALVRSIMSLFVGVVAVNNHVASDSFWHTLVQLSHACKRANIADDDPSPRPPTLTRKVLLNLCDWQDDVYWTGPLIALCQYVTAPTQFRVAALTVVRLIKSTLIPLDALCELRRLYRDSVDNTNNFYTGCLAITMEASEDADGGHLQGKVRKINLPEVLTRHGFDSIVQRLVGMALGVNIRLRSEGRGYAVYRNLMEGEVTKLADGVMAEYDKYRFYGMVMFLIGIATGARDSERRAYLTSDIDVEIVHREPRLRLSFTGLKSSKAGVRSSYVLAHADPKICPIFWMTLLLSQRDWSLFRLVRADLMTGVHLKTAVEAAKISSEPETPSFFSDQSINALGDARINLNLPAARIVPAFGRSPKQSKSRHELDELDDMLEEPTETAGMAKTTSVRCAKTLLSLLNRELFQVTHLARRYAVRTLFRTGIMTHEIATLFWGKSDAHTIERYQADGSLPPMRALAGRPLYSGYQIPQNLLRVPEELIDDIFPFSLNKHMMLKCVVGLFSAGRSNHPFVEMMARRDSHRLFQSSLRNMAYAHLQAAAFIYADESVRSSWIFTDPTLSPLARPSVRSWLEQVQQVVADIKSVHAVPKPEHEKLDGIERSIASLRRDMRFTLRNKTRQYYSMTGKTIVHRDLYLHALPSWSVEGDYFLGPGISDFALTAYKPARQRLEILMGSLVELAPKIMPVMSQGDDKPQSADSKASSTFEEALAIMAKLHLPPMALDVNGTSYLAVTHDQETLRLLYGIRSLPVSHPFCDHGFDMDLLDPESAPAYMGSTTPLHFAAMDLVAMLQHCGRWDHFQATFTLKDFVDFVFYPPYPLVPPVARALTPAEYPDYHFGPNRERTHSTKQYRGLISFVVQRAHSIRPFMRGNKGASTYYSFKNYFPVIAVELSDEMRLIRAVHEALAGYFKPSGTIIGAGPMCEYRVLMRETLTRLGMDETKPLVAFIREAIERRASWSGCDLSHPRNEVFLMVDHHLVPSLKRGNVYDRILDIKQ